MPGGGPLRASRWGERYFRPAVAAAGLGQGLRVHDLRHTAASLAIREDASVKIVQAVLGHRLATQTLDRHGHLYPSDLDAPAERLDTAHAAAATEVWPHCRPAKAKGQVDDLACWWRWGDSNSTTPVSPAPGQGAVGGATSSFAERPVSAPARCCPPFTGRLRTQYGPRVRSRLVADAIAGSGPPRPGTDRPAGHGKADPATDHPGGGSRTTTVASYPSSRVGAVGSVPASRTSPAAPSQSTNA
jgi:hypothetical protein